MRTDIHSEWRDFLGALGWISIVTALAAIALAVITVLTSERRSRNLTVPAIAAALGVVTLGYWVWVIERILDTT